MGILTTDHTTVQTFQIPPSISKEKVLSMLHNHDAMISMSPLAVSHIHLDKSDAKVLPGPAPTPTAEAYEITQDLTLSQSEEMRKNRSSWYPSPIITFKAWHDNREDGLHSDVFAPLGMTITIDWVVREEDQIEEFGGGKVLILEETAVLAGNRLLVAFSRAGQDESHERLVRVLIQRLLDEQGQGDMF